MKHGIKMMLGLAVAALIYTGCKKEPLNNLTAEESRIYITDHDSSVNFGSFKTFAVSDSINVIKNGKSEKMVTAEGTAFINAATKYLKQNGYVEVANDQSPDLGVNVNRIINTSTGYISNNDYWDYYGNYYDPYYWGYPGYGYYSPYSYSVYQIKEGAVSIDLLDLKNASTKNKIEVIWTGLIRGSGIYTSGVADSQVMALFNQSPYLKTN
ncbi:MAG: DUF4136 domain-containing protein [Ginsengibacter sp.]